jgi:hypothetical protein
MFPNSQKLKSYGLAVFHTTYPGDPNDDGFLDIRDYLYINTDGCP